MSIIDKRFSKFASKFLSVHLVLLMDVVLSFMASALVALVAYLALKPSIAANTSFIITWAASSILASLLMVFESATPASISLEAMAESVYAQATTSGPK